MQRSRQLVSTKVERRDVTLWMMQRVEEAGSEPAIASQAIDFFSSIFPNRKNSVLVRNTYRRKASRWWRQRYVFIQQLCSIANSRLYITTTNVEGIGRKRFALKTVKGRGKKLKPWVTYVYQFLDEEFERLSQLEVKLNSSMLQDIAITALQLPESPVQAIEVNPLTGITYLNHISSRFIERYRERSNIVRRRMCSNRTRSLQFREWTDRLIAYHLGSVRNRFLTGDLLEEWAENAETHFCYDNDNRYVLSKRGSISSYKDFVSGTEGFTVVLRLIGGPNARIASPFFIFKNESGNYPILGVPDNAPGCSYRTQRRG